MTNHEWIKSLTPEQFALEVMDSDFWSKGCNPKNCPSWRKDGTCRHPDGELGCTAASIRWLLSEHEEETHENGSDTKPSSEDRTL